MIEAILVPVDETPESERAVSVGAALAGAIGTRLELVTVESPNVDAFATSGYHERLLSGVPPTIETDSTVSFSNDSVAAAIAAVADARPGSVVCMATRARGPVSELVLGSTADGLLRASRAPMVLVGPACDPSWPDGPRDASRVVVALDGSSLDVGVIAAALSWAAALDAEVHFVTVAGDLGLPWAPPPAAEALRLAADAAERAGRPATTSLLEGDNPAVSVLRQVDRRAALLVVGSHRRGPWARIALGANALWLVHRAPCPVLIA